MPPILSRAKFCFFVALFYLCFISSAIVFLLFRVRFSKIDISLPSRFVATIYNHRLKVPGYKEDRDSSTILRFRFLKYKIQQHAELRLEEMIEQSRKTSHFLSNQETCLQTVVSFLPNLQILIARCFDSQQLRASLDENPTKKV